MHLPCSSLAILAFIASTVLPPAAAFPSYAVHPLKDSPASVTVGHSYHTHNGTTNRTVDHNYYAHNGTALKKRDHTIVTCHGSDMCQASRTDITKDSTNFLIFNDLVEKLKSGIEPARKYSNIPNNGDLAGLCMAANDVQRKAIPGLRGMMFRIMQTRNTKPKTYCTMNGQEMLRRFQEMKGHGCSICGSSWSPENGCDFIVDHIDDPSLCNLANAWKPVGDWPNWESRPGI